ncbi:hypothetical protein [Streptomyces sp. NPDC001404]|uniref:hypothetical protein n=1 Tax=Streptomyces sp. NPDC001404 TaxID=3364571 RepID=UPI0036B427CE
MVHRAESADDVELGVVIHRADGTIEHIGLVAATYRSPLRRAWWRLYGKRRAQRRIRRANRSAARLAAVSKE